MKVVTIIFPQKTVKKQLYASENQDKTEIFNFSFQLNVAAERTNNSSDDKHVSTFTFIDLFAGIGGFHTAMSNLGGVCVFASDWNKHARTTYEANYGMEPAGDITQVDAEDIPPFDVLCAGFPCQPFSIAGVSKKNSLGRPHGFEDEKQGNLFFEIIRIANHHKPKMMFLENVKNLKSHDKGNTWKVIESTLKDNNYHVFTQVVDAKGWVPQHRERMFIICYDKTVYPEPPPFTYPEPPQQRLFTLPQVLSDPVDPKYTLSDNLWAYLQKHKENSKAKGSGFGYGLVFPDETDYTRTMSARYYKDGSEILIWQGNSNPRKLTPNEARKLFGYPDSFKIVVSDTQAYKQFGNSVVVPAVQATAENALKAGKLI